jgi:hypothetical protein
MKDVLRIIEMKHIGGYSLEVLFSDGFKKRVDLLPLLTGPVFEPMRDPEYFARVTLDPISGTVVWPNGADLAPEAIYELPS